jgi:heterodisulfide reductase subunit A
MVACPLHINVKAYISLVAAKKYQKALDIIRLKNPFPGVCGRVCTHPCEEKCNRREIDNSVAICSLKRFVSDLLGMEKPSIPLSSKSKEQKVAVIGAGPCGLTCAYDLAIMGYKVTVFEAHKIPGGMLSLGIPSYRLPREIINKEIEIIKDQGVEIKLNTPIGPKLPLSQLKRDGFSAIFIAIGAHKGLKLKVPGEDEYEGFVDCITFLRRVNFGCYSPLGKKVIVIGGGNSAIDAARTALRLGSEVYIVYRRSRKEMPAGQKEIQDAEEEGVKIHYLAAPVKILGKNKKLSGMECIKMRLGEPDASGRRRPIPIKGSEFTIEADAIIPAISQEPDLSLLEKDHSFKISKWNSFVVDQETLSTNVEGFFAGGDAVTGPATVIEAIAAGHKAAIAIAEYLERREHIFLKETSKSSLEFEVIPPKIKRREKAKMPQIPLEERISSFKEVEIGFSEEIALNEAKRCLRCGPCTECYICTKECQYQMRLLETKEERRIVRILKVINGTSLDKKEIKVEIQKDGRQIPGRLHGIWSSVREEFCRGCEKCVNICEYGAVSIKNGSAYIEPLECKGCGVCVSNCPSFAILPGILNDKEILNIIKE